MVSGKNKCVSGTFSVYQSEKAKDFTSFEDFPIGFEAVFFNDPVGKSFATQFSESVKNQSGGAVLFKMEGIEGEPLVGIDCFFTSADVLRRVLNESLPDTTLFHAEKEKVIPKTILVDEAKKIGKQSVNLPSK